MGGLPINSMVIFRGYVANNQRVMIKNHIVLHVSPKEWEKNH